MATLSDLAVEIAGGIKGRAPAVHTHTQAQVDGLVAALAGKQDATPIDDADYVYAITDEADKVAIGVTVEGETFLRRTDTADVSEVHAFILAGQSNMSGRARPFTGRDTPDRRVFQYGARRRVVERATVPLDMHDAPAGMSYATVFAREYLRRMPEGVAVLLIPAAHGGTGFTSTTENPAPAGYSTHAGGTWQVGYTASAVNLYDEMLTQTTEALTAAQETFGVPASVKAMLWHQGESDAMNGVTETDYGTHMRALIDGVRAHVGDSRLPVVMGGMSPDWMAGYPAARPIHLAHLGLLLSRSNTAFTPGSSGMGRFGDEIHYGLDGIEDLGVRSVRGLLAAIANHADFPIAPTPLVTAKRVANTVTASWEQPLCRVSHYKLEYRIDGGSWVRVSFPNTHLREAAIANVPDGTCEVRIGTDYLGTVAWSAPVIAYGG